MEIHLAALQPQLPGHLHTSEGAYGCDMPVAYQAVDLEEEKEVQDFLITGCGCRLLKSVPCTLQFTTDHYIAMQSYAAELSSGNLTTSSWVK